MAVPVGVVEFLRFLTEKTWTRFFRPCKISLEIDHAPKITQFFKTFILFHIVWSIYLTFKKRRLTAIGFDYYLVDVHIKLSSQSTISSPNSKLDRVELIKVSRDSL